MRLVLMHNWVFFFNFSLFSLEFSPHAPKLKINGSTVFSHHIDNPEEFSVTTDTLFCIVMPAIRRDKELCAGQDEKFFADRHLAEYSSDIELISSDARFAESPQKTSMTDQGWLYYIFKTGKQKGKTSILFSPNSTRFLPKKFTLKIW